MSEDKRPWDIKGTTDPLTKEEYAKFIDWYKESNKPKPYVIYTAEKNLPEMKKVFGITDEIPLKDRNLDELIHLVQHGELTMLEFVNEMQKR